MVAQLVHRVPLMASWAYAALGVAHTGDSMLQLDMADTAGRTGTGLVEE